MKQLLLLLFSLAVLSTVTISCSKKEKCTYEGHELKKDAKNGCHFEINGDVVKVDDSYCDCD